MRPVVLSIGLVVCPPLTVSLQPFQARLSVSIPRWSNVGQARQRLEVNEQPRDPQTLVRTRGRPVQTDMSQADKVARLDAVVALHYE